jgi:hypothetical protein
MGQQARGQVLVVVVVLAAQPLLQQLQGLEQLVGPMAVAVAADSQMAGLEVAGLAAQSVLSGPAIHVPSHRPVLAHLNLLELK